MDEIMAITRNIDKLEVQRKRAIEKSYMRQNDELLKTRKENRNLKEMNISLKAQVQDLQQKLKQAQGQ